MMIRKIRIIPTAILLYILLLAVSAWYSHTNVEVDDTAVNMGADVMLQSDELYLGTYDTREINHLHPELIYRNSLPDSATLSSQKLFAALSEHFSVSKDPKDTILIYGSGLFAHAAIQTADKLKTKYKKFRVILKDPVLYHDSYLFGNKDLNIALMRIRGSFRSFWYHAIPHFGLLSDNSALLAKKFILDTLHESDISIAKDIDLPVTILHCTEKRMDPVLREWINGQLEITFAELCGDLYASDLNSLVSSASENYDPDMQDAEPIPIAGLQSLISVFFMIILISLANEDLAIMGAGLLVSQGMVSFGFGLFSSLSGIFIGDMAIYLIGSGIGMRALKTYPVKWFLSPEQVKQTGKWFRRRGPVLLIISRFIPGSRFPIYFCSGLMQIGKRKFLTYFGITTLIWTPVFMGISYLLGDAMIQYFGLYRERVIWAVLIIVVILVVIYALSTRFLRKKVYESD